MVGGMNYLLDTNIWLELLLNQAKRDEVHSFFKRNETSKLAITDFALYSIGIFLARVKKLALLRRFLGDILGPSGIKLVRLPPDQILQLPSIIRRFGLDFDDAYQYLAAESHGLVLISFDSAFDRTGRGRRLPSQV
jgi:hypothetical protein